MTAPARPLVAPLLAVALSTTLSLPGSAAEPSPPSLPLFNGRDLAGWSTWLVDTRTQDPRGVFSVTNGMIRISGDGLGYLGTLREFSDYQLTVEWRWGQTNTAWGDRIGKARDSGIFLHATGPDGNSHDGHGAFMAALECNLFQGATGDLLLIRGTDAQGHLIAPRVVAEVAETRDPEGWFTWMAGGRPQPVERWGRINHREKSPRWRDVFDLRVPGDLEHPPGEWNRVECLARGSHLQFRVNGVLANELTSVWPRRGRILLQCEGSEIWFRRVDLAPAPPMTTPVGSDVDM